MSGAVLMLFALKIIVANKIINILILYANVIDTNN